MDEIEEKGPEGETLRRVVNETMNNKKNCQMLRSLEDELVEVLISKGMIFIVLYQSKL